MPLTAATVGVPPSVPPPGLVPMATVTLDVSVVTTLPRLSSTFTVTAGLMVAPAVVLLGCTPKTSCVAVPAVMLKALEVALVRVPSAAVSV